MAAFKIVFLLFTLLILNVQIGQAQQVSVKKQLPLADVSFESIFGTSVSEGDKTIYCLLGSGFFRSPRSSISDSLIHEWLLKHQQAIVIPVSSFGPTEIDNPDSRMIYCWVVQGGDTLNNYLIRNGCFPGGTMLRPKTWKEMNKRERDLYKGTGEKPDVQVHVDKETYAEFVEQIKSAEIYARDNSLGIWHIVKEE